MPTRAEGRTIDGECGVWFVVKKAFSGSGKTNFQTEERDGEPAGTFGGW